MNEIHKSPLLLTSRVGVFLSRNSEKRLEFCHEQPHGSKTNDHRYVSNAALAFLRHEVHRDNIIDRWEVFAGFTGKSIKDYRLTVTDPCDWMAFFRDESNEDTTISHIYETLS